MRRGWSIASMLLVAAASVSAQDNGTIIYRFQNGADGAIPAAPLVADAFGNLYGTTGAYAYGPDYGSVFRLTPPKSPGGKFEETTLYSFHGGSDGAGPLAALVIGPEGNLYGTTSSGGPNNVGIVFKLSPPPSGTSADWTEQILHAFTGANDGTNPTGPLARDAAGNLYGVTSAGGTGGSGTIFKLSHSFDPGAWPETVIYNFNHVYDGCVTPENIVLGGDSIYAVCYAGGSSGDGVVISLTLSGSAWVPRIAFEFPGGFGGWRPMQIVFGPDGNLYGTTFEGGVENGGIVFELLRPAQGYLWSEKIIHDFPAYTGNHPIVSGVGVSFGPDGVIYGTEPDGGLGFGSVYQLTPPSSPGDRWTKTGIYAFPGGFDGYFPEGAPALGFGGLLYGTTGSGGFLNPCSSNDGCGTVYAVKP